MKLLLSLLILLFINIILSQNDEYEYNKNDFNCNKFPNNISFNYLTSSLSCSNNFINNKIFPIDGNVFENNYLFEFELFDGSLTGILPNNMFQHLKTLTDFVIDNTDMYGKIPNEINEMSINDNTGLLRLKLSNNKFSGNFPNDLTNLQRLRSLDISNNLLNGTLENLLFSEKNINNMHLIDVSYNSFNGKINDNLLKLLKNDESSVIRLNNNKFTTISNYITDKNFTSKLFLGNNDFDCNCEFLNWFTPFIINNPNKIIDIEQLTCKLGDNYINGFRYHLPQSPCYTINNDLIVTPYTKQSLKIEFTYPSISHLNTELAIHFLIEVYDSNTNEFVTSKEIWEYVDNVDNKLFTVYINGLIENNNYDVKVSPFYKYYDGIVNLLAHIQDNPISPDFILDSSIPILANGYTKADIGDIDITPDTIFQLLKEYPALNGPFQYIFEYLLLPLEDYESQTRNVYGLKVEKHNVALISSLSPVPTTSPNINIQTINTNSPTNIPTHSPIIGSFSPTIFNEYEKNEYQKLMDIDCNDFINNIPILLKNADYFNGIDCDGTVLDNQNFPLAEYFQNLTSIFELRLLNSESFSGNFDPNMFQYVTNLIDLVIRSTGMDGEIPSEISLLYNNENSGLLNLDLRSNKFNGKLPNLSNLKRLRNIKLSDNMFNGEINNIKLPNTNSTEYLDLSYNNFNGTIDKNLINNVCNTDNECNNFNSFGATVIKLNDNNIQHIKKDVFNNYKGYLYLGNNDYICNCELLQWFPEYLNNNPGKVLDAPFVKCGDTSSLSISGDPISTIALNYDAPCYYPDTVMATPLSSGDILVKWNYPYINNNDPDLAVHFLIEAIDSSTGDLITSTYGGFGNGNIVNTIDFEKIINVPINGEYDIIVYAFYRYYDGLVINIPQILSNPKSPLYKIDKEVPILTDGYTSNDIGNVNITAENIAELAKKYPEAFNIFYSDVLPLSIDEMAELTRDVLGTGKVYKNLIVGDSTYAPTKSSSPTELPTKQPTTKSPSKSPTKSSSPTIYPTDSPTVSPVIIPTSSPTIKETESPVSSTSTPTKSPTSTTTTNGPTKSPISTTTNSPTILPYELIDTSDEVIAATGNEWQCYWYWYTFDDPYCDCSCGMIDPNCNLNYNELSSSNQQLVSQDYSFPYSPNGLLSWGCGFGQVCGPNSVCINAETVEAPVYCSSANNENECNTIEPSSCGDDSVCEWYVDTEFQVDFELNILHTNVFNNDKQAWQNTTWTESKWNNELYWQLSCFAAFQSAVEEIAGTSKISITSEPAEQVNDKDIKVKFNIIGLASDTQAENVKAAIDTETERQNLLTLAGEYISTNYPNLPMLSVSIVEDSFIVNTKSNDEQTGWCGCPGLGDVGINNSINLKSPIVQSTSVIGTVCAIKSIFF